MRMFEDSVTYQFIGNVTKGGDGAPADILNLPEGAVAIVGEDNTVYANAAGVTAGMVTSDRMRIAQKVNGQLVFSPYFTSDDIRGEVVTYSEEVPQITYLGYNGTDGELDDANDATYTLGVVLQNTQGVLNNTPMIKTVPAYMATGDQEGLALTLKDAFDRIMGKENRRSVLCERVHDGTAINVDDATTATLMRVTHGSRNVTFHTSNGVVLAPEDCTIPATEGNMILPYWGSRTFTFIVADDAAHLLHIGDYNLAVGAGGSEQLTSDDIVTAINANCNGDVRASNGATTTVTVEYMPNFKALAPVVFSAVDNRVVTIILGTDFRVAYGVEIITAENNADLDRPWQGPSGYIAIDAEAQVTQAARAADATVDDWGLVFIGQSPNTVEFNTVTETYHPVTFKLTWDRVSAVAGAGADPTTVTYDVAASPSRSSYFEVAAREIYTTMNEGNPFISSYPPTNYRRKADPKLKYDTYVIQATDTGYTSATTGQRPISKYNIYVALSNFVDAAGLTLDRAEFNALIA